MIAKSPSAFTISTIAPDDPVAVVVQALLAAGLHRFEEHEPGARSGEVENLHRLRTSARRLRSELRCLEAFLAEGFAESLQGELKWFGQVLGAVRDLDVLMQRLRRSAGEELERLEPLFQMLAARREAARQALGEALDGARLRALLATLTEAAEQPPIRVEAERSCGEALPELAEAAWRRLKKRGRALRDGDPDEDFHEVRKRAKRARYVAEAVAGALDPVSAEAARRFARRATDVQDVLGEHQDAVVAVQEINASAAEHPHDGPFNLAAGQLLERQHQAAAEARSAFFDAWERLDRKKRRRWFRS